MTAQPDHGLKLVLGRRYRFAASHRLHTDRLSEEENARVYGKCSNLYGHGHNYVVEVHFSGEPDTKTGMVANIAELDEYVQREVLDTFDHRNLSVDVPAFRTSVATTENLCREVFARLKGFPAARLERVRIEETGKNSFEYTGEEPKGGLL